MPDVRHTLVIQRPARLLGIHRGKYLPEFRVTHDPSSHTAWSNAQLQLDRKLPSNTPWPCRIIWRAARKPLKRQARKSETRRIMQAKTALSKSPRLLDQVRHKIRAKHYSLPTENTYVHWIKRFIVFHDKRH